MKIYTYGNQIVSLENVSKIFAMSSKTLAIEYATGGRNQLCFYTAKDLDESIGKIAAILQESIEEVPILFEGLYFRKSDLAYVRLSNYSIDFTFGGRGGQLAKTTISYSSERTAKAKYQELLDKLK
jgi:hypothetical protein